MPDGLVFLGDCLYEAIYAPERYYTPEKIFPLFGAVLRLGAEHYLTGHGGEVMTRSDLEAWAEQLQHAYILASEPVSEAATLNNLADNAQLFHAGKMFKRENSRQS